jgi:hypothetical protein
VRHLLLCQDVVYEFDNPAAPYSLQGVVTALGPEPGVGYPLRQDLLWVFAQASGDPGEYELWIDLVPLDDDGDDAGEGTSFGPWVLIVHEGVYVESRAWRLRNIPFAGPRVYEFRLRCGSDILTREQLLLAEA